MTDRCEVPRCRSEVELIYLDHRICADHWNQFTADGVPPDRLRMVLGVVAETATAKGESMATTKRRSKTTKRTSKVAAKKAAPTKASRNDELVVFAIRVTQAERDAIHKAAGPRRATQFVRALSVAASRNDMKGIQRVLKEAREARA